MPTFGQGNKEQPRAEALLIARHKILAFARFQAILFGLIGLLLGMLYSFGGLVLDVSVSMNWLQSEETSGLSYGTFLPLER